METFVSVTLMLWMCLSVGVEVMRMLCAEVRVCACVWSLWCGYVSVCELVCVVCNVHVLGFCVCKSV